MAEDYSRRANTNDYQTVIDRKVTSGEEVLRKLEAKIDSFDDIIDRRNAVDGWIATTGEKLSGVYNDGAVAKGFTGGESLADLILGHLSHDQAIMVLTEIVQEKRRKRLSPLCLWL